MMLSAAVARHSRRQVFHRLNGQPRCSVTSTSSAWLQSPSSWWSSSSSSMTMESQGQWDQKRWFAASKGARMGQHLDSLREQATRTRHEEAKEKRLHKKAKKGQHAAGDVSPSAVGRSRTGGDPDEDDDVGMHHDDEEDTPDDAESLPEPKQVKEMMIKVVDRLKESFKAIRGAEPTAELFDSILVDAYGERTPISSVAQVVIVSPTLANVTCFDPAIAKDVLKAIRDTLELNPQIEEEGVVKVPLPRVSMETRQKLVKQLGKQAEASRTRIRNMRRKALDTVKLAKDGKLEGISKDDAFRVAKEIDVVVEEVTKLINDAVHDKEASIMAT